MRNWIILGGDAGDKAQGEEAYEGEKLRKRRDAEGEENEEAVGETR